MPSASDCGSRAARTQCSTGTAGSAARSRAASASHAPCSTSGSGGTSHSTRSSDGACADAPSARAIAASCGGVARRAVTSAAMRAAPSCGSWPYERRSASACSRR
eukprot:7379051-Prymnesium_polylepis.2